ncbi:beta-1,4-galactosyltransferase 2-like [Sycon ciliatum]|uniref:beta-1,4-galactosyltransferase 2-like n=1 Tax=Sycon ciliatum TaxID=27933 RepID=UPI0020AB4913|eukprot:scpid83531/ scgid23687/ Beta-1,4-galactosyltransferase 1; UDP-Gal:beta-GlcNAc beta-1,4-galactosyltransferase 1; UDP-galactose:beta-N-acetylglucosamine beta-1,4-galactosyltransferase 1; Lactose synthase A protein; N-acetyllactosamine synthase; Nal synthase; Beta-N-acetylglucosaminylglycopeptide beta-1,4-galactosyltransferase; Beta-N-acetylglucosaminyl-glycolipid beta-1,4-galactosyltransferase; Processed beta-1,4-galactosyltransferase 1
MSPLRRFLWLLAALLVTITVATWVGMVKWWTAVEERGSKVKSEASHLPGREEYRQLQKLVLQKEFLEPAESDRTGSNTSRVDVDFINARLAPAGHSRAVQGNGGRSMVGGGRPVSSLESLLSGSATEHYTHNSHFATSGGNKSRDDKNLPTCSPPDGGVTSREVDLEKVPSEKELIGAYKDVRAGGRWAPSDCRTDERVAVIVPFRTRELHLLIFLKYMHRFLQHQRLHYGIYIVDQNLGSAFNRAMLLNIGFVEALRDDGYTCFVFHDVDHIPVDDLLRYRCGNEPVHMAAMTDKWNWGLPYAQFVGGVTMQSSEHMLLMNGFSNNYWGWGGEDDDMTQRWIYAGLRHHRPAGGHGRYATIKVNHTRSSKPNPARMQLLKNSKQRIPYDGLNTLHYKLVEKIRHPLYTRIRVLIKRIGLR